MNPIVLKWKFCFEKTNVKRPFNANYFIDERKCYDTRPFLNFHSNEYVFTPFDSSWRALSNAFWPIRYDQVLGCKTAKNCRIKDGATRRQIRFSSNSNRTHHPITSESKEKLYNSSTSIDWFVFHWNIQKNAQVISLKKKSIGENVINSRQCLACEWYSPTYFLRKPR